MTRAPRVLVSGLVLSQPPGGVRRHNAELLPRIATRLAARGGRLALLVGAAPLPFDLPESVERIVCDIASPHPVLRAAREGRALTQALTAARAAGSPFDLVHTAHLPAPRRLEVPYTLTLHDLRSIDLASAPLARRLLGKGIIGQALQHAARVFTVSETVRARIAEGWRVPTAKLALVPNAADHFVPAPRCVGPDAPILHVGHLEPRKNLELLLHALAVDPDLPRVLLAGSPKGQHGERLAALARELGVEARVDFHGPFEEADLPGLYAGAACVALPSHLEGFGIVALEAQRARVPVAVSTSKALMEVAGPDVPHFVPNDPAGCAAALRRAIATDPTTLERHAERAARFTWDAAADAWVAGWDGLVDE